MKKNSIRTINRCKYAADNRKKMRRRNFQPVLRYAKANNNYIRDTDLSYLTYLDKNNLYGQAISQEFPIY